FRTVYGLELNMRVIGRTYFCPNHGTYTTTSPDKFIGHFKPWELGGLPYFGERPGCTHQLFDLIVQLCPTCSIGSIKETIKQMHLLHDLRIRSSWTKDALLCKERGDLKTQIPGFPTKLVAAVEDTGHDGLLSINAYPSETFIREVYDCFLRMQRFEESERYMRTLAGLSIGIDATIKVAKKANIYLYAENKKQINVINAFEGGLTTFVNEDLELVGYEMLLGNSPLDFCKVLREYAERSEELGVDFLHQGQVSVDKCCEFRSAIQIVLPEMCVLIDLWHLENRIMSTIPKKSAFHKAVKQELSKALIQTPSKGKGEPTAYWPKKVQKENLEKLWTKYESLGGVWMAETAKTFPLQVEHAGDGCLQPRLPSLPSHTSGNENWHGFINSLTRGHASSLPTVLGLLADATLRRNISLKLRHFSQSPTSPSRLFRAEANDNPNLFLLEDILRDTERLTGIQQPRFLDICPGHHFGLVKR
ncbi:hypothetical protein M422DRAFT_118752, partial [Sphaerobolus stellatus SS14]